VRNGRKTDAAGDHIHHVTDDLVGWLTANAPQTQPIETIPMETQKLQAAIDAAWDKRDSINSATKGDLRTSVEAALEGLDGRQIPRGRECRR